MKICHWWCCSYFQSNRYDISTEIVWQWDVDVFGTLSRWNTFILNAFKNRYDYGEIKIAIFCDNNNKKDWRECFLGGTMCQKFKSSKNHMIHLYECVHYNLHTVTPKKKHSRKTNNLDMKWIDLPKQKKINSSCSTFIGVIYTCKKLFKRTTTWWLLWITTNSYQKKRTIDIYLMIT